MAEPSSTSAAVISSSITMATFLPGIDGNALIGAFAGATLFVATAKEIGIVLRFIYLFISILMGYFLAPSIISHSVVEEPALAGFIGGLFCITASLKIMDYIQNTNIANLLRGKPK